MVEQVAHVEVRRSESPLGSDGAGPSPGAPPGGRRRRRWLLGLLAVVAVAGVAVGVVLWAPWVPRAPGVPRGVRAESPTATSVLVRWGASTGGLKVERYVIVRDGAELASVAAARTSYLDTALAPGTVHRYAVVAVSGKKRSRQSAAAVVRTLTPSPVGLAAGARTASSLAIRWSRPPRSPVPDAYVVARDGKTLARVAGTTTAYLDRGLPPATTFRYTVAAAWGGSRSAPSVALAAKTLALGPVRLRASGATASTIVVRWSPPPGGRAPDRYEVARDGVAVGTVPGTRMSYTDAGLPPSTAFTYRVTALWGRERSAPSAALAARTLTPPVSEARLDGPWLVHFRVTSTDGGTLAVGDTWEETWNFQPKCAAGACAVVVAGSVYGHAFTMTLTRTGADYAGTIDAHITHCGPEGDELGTWNTLTLRLAVGKGRVVGTEWSAGSWAGTFVIASPYMLSASGLFECPAQAVGASVVAEPGSQW